ncbi:hypothetical protein BDZ45DRAFT_769457 [Acephala macrosclerotiorum]|nr:hypothetical protein BDZ45DRAFT_769457 [Acephala macrosclerotiorum]
MGSGERHSRRLAKEKAIEDEIPAKRTRTTNTKTLAAFSQQQPPIAKAFKRKRAKTISKTNGPSDPLLVTPKKLADQLANQLNTAPLDAPSLSNSSSHQHSPLAKRSKPIESKAKVESFNSNLLGPNSYHMIFKLIPVIDSVSKRVMLKTADINSSFFEGLDEIISFIERGYIFDWANKRTLRGGDRPTRRPFDFTIGSLKSNSFQARVQDPVEFESVLAYVRQAFHGGDKKNSGVLIVNCHYVTFNRQRTLFMINVNRKQIKTQKTSKSTPLYISFDAVPTSEAKDDKSDSTSLSIKKPGKSRDSVT